MEIFIGIRGNTRQLGFDIDMSENQLMAKVNEALASAHGVLDLTDTKGQRTLVPAHALAYVQIAAKTERRVGFAIQTNEAGEPERTGTARGTPASSIPCGLRPSGECPSCAPRGA